jgi:hypothetical protein
LKDKCKRPDFTYQLGKILRWKGRYTHGKFSSVDGIYVETYGTNAYYRNIMVVFNNNNNVFTFEQVSYDVILTPWIIDVNKKNIYAEGFVNEGRAYTDEMPEPKGFAENYDHFMKLYKFNIKRDYKIIKGSTQGYDWDHDKSVFMFFSGVDRHTHSSNGFDCILLESPEVAKDIYREYQLIRLLSSNLFNEREEQYKKYSQITDQGHVEMDDDDRYYITPKRRVRTYPIPKSSCLIPKSICIIN